MLYAYGGFQINLTPGFTPTTILFVEQGGIYCEANLRGGSEYGEEWHKAGMLENKQNVFDDFIAARRVPDRRKIHVDGQAGHPRRLERRPAGRRREVQRPDLYAVCLPAVGVMDMLRYHKFTIGWGWGRRVRLERRRGAVRLPLQILPAA